MAETGPSIADDAVAVGELAPGELGLDSEAEIEKLAHAGWAPDAVQDPEGEAEAHPS